MSKSLLWAVVCGVVTLALAIAPLAARYSSESHNRAVELAVEYWEVEELASTTGQDFAAVLARFKQAGASGVVVYEDTVPYLIQRGDLIPATTLLPGRTTWQTNGALGKRLSAALEQKFRWAPAKHGSGYAFSGPIPETSIYCQPAPSSPSKTYAYDRRLQSLYAAGIGIDPAVADAVHRAGLDLICRVGNYPGADQTGIDWTLRDLKQAGCSTVVFYGTDVLGSRDLIDYTAERLHRYNLRYGYVEFGKQAGDAKLLAKTADIAIRVHSVLPAELSGLTPDKVVGRFILAAKERNDRLLYVRLVSAAGEDPVEANAKLIASIARGLRDRGLDPAAAHPYSPPADTPLRTAVAILAPLLGALALCRALGLPWWLSLLAPLPGLAADAAGAGPPHAFHALMTAVLFPTAATLAGANSSSGKGSGGALWLFLLVCAVSVCGAAAVAAMLGTLPYMVKADQFMGVKATHVIPVLVVGLIWMFRVHKGGGFGENVRWWHLGIAVVGAVLVAVLVVRTGNDAASVSGGEMELRSSLDKLMMVRPRTKEIFFGHPLLIAGLFALAMKRPRFAPLFLAAGALGQASILNTFSHIHTPLVVSAIRTLWGVVVGGILGVVFCSLFNWLERWVPRRWSGSSS